MDKRPDEIPCKSMKGQYIKAGELTVKESVNSNRLYIKRPFQHTLRAFQVSASEKLNN